MGGGKYGRDAGFGCIVFSFPAANPASACRVVGRTLAPIVTQRYTVDLASWRRPTLQRKY
jgi:hypothetical protein